VPHVIDVKMLLLLLLPLVAIFSFRCCFYLLYSAASSENEPEHWTAAVTNAIRISQAGR